MTPFHDKLEDQLLHLVPSYIEYLRLLVQTPSQYGIEAQCQAIVEEKMASLGHQVDKIYSRDDPNAINLAMHIKGSNKGKSLVLNAHADITPVEGRWRYPPYEARVEDGILFGRGAQDDKAGIAIILMVAELLQSLGIKLKGDLILHVVVDDESSGNGSKALVEAGHGGDGVVICDGTWPERIIYAHLGQVWLDISISGTVVAACVEHRGVNPIYLGCEFIRRLRDWGTDMNSRAEGFENIDAPFFVNVGSFHSGIWHGSTPEKAELQIQIGFGPTHEPQEILKIAQDIAGEVSDQIQVRQGMLSTPACSVPPNGEFIQELKSIVEANSDKEVRLQAVTGHCDMRYFGTNNVCLYGPGAGWNAHGIDERYRLSDMAVVARNLAQFAIKWCGIA